MKEIAKNFKGHYLEITLGPLFKLVEAVLELFVPLVTASIIDTGVKNRDTGFVLQRGLFMLGLAAAGVAAALTCQYFAARAAGHFGRSLRAQVFAHVLRLSPAETAPYGAGGLITRVTNDVNQIQAGVNMAIRLGTRVPFLTVGSLIMAFLLDVRIGFVFLIATVAITVVLLLIMGRTLPSYGRIQAGQDSLSRLATENLEGVRVIRAFSRQGEEQKGFDAAGDTLTRLVVRVGRLSAALNPLTSVAANGAIILIVWLGARFTFAGDMQPGIIIALVNYMNQILLALLVAANLIVLFTRAVASAKRIADVLGVQPTITDGPGATPVAGAPAVAFRDVSFAYHEGAHPALCGISFAAAKGTTLGIIGGTGSGKSTIGRMILRFYDAESGGVDVHGADVRGYTLADLRRRVGYVPQGARLFSGTVRRNLLFSAGGASDDEMWQALETAQAAAFVRKMPGGLDAAIEEGGQNLSGGQRQRLTIARALVRRPEILILDDASSALDYATDAALRSALRAFAQATGPSTGNHAMTTVLISQRAAALRDADHILVLNDGVIAGQGTHSQLYAENEIYREICQSQGVSA